MPVLQQPDIDYLLNQPSEGDPRREGELVGKFRSLLDWWVRPELRPEHDLDRRPDLPTQPGSCVVILARKPRKDDGTRRPPMLADAFPMPLQWLADESGEGHSRMLPQKLRDLAQNVIDDLLAGSDIPDGRWRLVPHPSTGFRHVDLSGLDDVLSWESGWASLVGGLYTAVWGFESNREVWASASRNKEFGAGEIGSAQAKMDAAADWGIRTFYVRTQETFTEPGGLDVVLFGYAPGRDDEPLASLTDYLTATADRPPSDADLETQCQYYMRSAFAQREAFYLDRVVEPLARDIRGKRNDLAPSPGATRLITTLGTNAGIIALGIRFSGASLVTLIVEANEADSEPIRRAMGLLRAHFGSRVRFDERKIDVTDRKRTIEDLRTLFPTAFLEADALSGRTVIDLTPGFALIKLVLAEVAPANIPRMFCHTSKNGDRANPRTSEYVVWTPEPRVPHAPADPG